MSTSHQIMNSSVFPAHSDLTIQEDTGMAKNTQDDTMDIDMIDITYEDGTTCSCEVIARFEVNDITYAALLPVDDEDSDILVYRYSETSDNDVDLDEITDEDEFNEVADALDEILDDLEFNSDSEE